MGYEWLLSAAMNLNGGLTTDEVLRALADAPRRWVQAVFTKNGAPGLSVWTRTPAGTPILVVLRPLGGFDHQIVYAAPMTPDQVTAFEEWEANQ
ncbi:hypothetical protein [Nocardia acidivorans]|uniref:hypothetical protein n=1 Tax=Nocardia acidivorans TaxID=404580 RepID=UPI00082D8FB0|nr:hypothetical protein [Nocardia acidivorans]